MCQREYLISRIFKLLLVLLKGAYFPRIAVSHKCFRVVLMEARPREIRGPRLQWQPWICVAVVIIVNRELLKLHKGRFRRYNICLWLLHVTLFKIWLSTIHTHTLTYDILKYHIASNVTKMVDTRITSAMVVGALFKRRRKRRREREVRE